MQSGAPGRQTDVKPGKRWTRKLVLGFFLFFGVIVVLESPLTRVRSVSVTGNLSIPEKDILTAAPVHQGMSLWQVNQDQTARDVMDKQPMISSVSVHTNYWNGQVVLQVAEKQIVGILESSGKFYNLLSDGKVYGELSANKGFIWPIVTTDVKLSVQTGAVPDPSLTLLCQQLSKVDSATSAQISEVHLDTFGDASLYLNNGFVAECKLDSLAKVTSRVHESVQYFLGKGYAPGLIDMTGAPPYRYTPFQPSSKKGSQP